MALLSSDVEMSVANEILDGVTENLTGQTRRRLSRRGTSFETRSGSRCTMSSASASSTSTNVSSRQTSLSRIVFTGVNGVGKTTAIAKLARTSRTGPLVVLANGDTYRAGANEQIRKHAENLDTKIISHEQGS